MKVHNIPSLNPLQLFRSPFQQQHNQQSRGGLRAEPRGHIPKTPSLLFEIELEDPPARAEAQDDSETQGILTNFRSLAVPWSKTEHELLAHWLTTQDGSTHDSMQALTSLAERLRNLGHPVSIRTALGGGWGGECLRNLRHSFLVCTVRGEEGAAVYIIDPAFREQFDLAHATPRYQQILEAIPATFVGTEERLVALVRALCQEIQGVFLEQNTTLPPWRDVAAQLSKWRPRRSLDRPLFQGNGAAAPSLDLALVRSVTSAAASSAAVARLSNSSAAGEPKLSSGPRALPPVPAPPVARPAAKSEHGSVPEVAGSSIKGTLYQRVAGPVQQLVSRSYTQGLLTCPSF